MVERPVLEKGHVKLIGHQRRADMMRQRRMRGHRWQVPRSAALISHGIGLVDAKGEGRVMIEEE